MGPLALSLAEGYDGYEYFSDAGLYNIDPTNAIPTEQSSEERYPTVIVIRARDINQGPIYYIWMVPISHIANKETPFDLSSFAAVSNLLLVWNSCTLFCLKKPFSD